MKNIVEAKIQWITAEEGGRQSPPLGPKYTTVARFEDERDAWLKEAWSLVVEFIELPDATLSHRVRVRFLAEQGPANLLVIGSAFELMEGNKSVARGVVTG
jgi:hypothetical protein